MKKRGKPWGGEALEVAKPVSPPHTPPLRARRCATSWSVLIYRLSPVCCCIGGVRLSRFFCSTGRESGPRSGPVPWDMANRRSLVYVHHTPIGTIPTQPTPKNTELFSIHCNIPQRRTATCPERGSARGKSGLRNSERLSPSQTRPLPKCLPEREPPTAQVSPLKGKRPLLKCPPEREKPTAQVSPKKKNALRQERTSDARQCTISGTIFSLILSIVHSLVYYKEHTSNLLTLKSESVILWSS